MANTATATTVNTAKHKANKKTKAKKRASECDDNNHVNLASANTKDYEHGKASKANNKAKKQKTNNNDGKANGGH